MIMREILYRGIPKSDSERHFFAGIWKDNCEGSFVYGSLIISKDKYYICVSALCALNCCINNGMTSMIEVIPETIGQYTGLTDKNGKKIFEGDICDMCFIGNVHSMKKITILYNCVGFEPVNPNEEHPDDRCWKCFWDSYGYKLWGTDYFTVIGNIHDNPELLKERFKE